jgi:hypothetical protein
LSSKYRKLVGFGDIWSKITFFLSDKLLGHGLSRISQSLHRWTFYVTNSVYQWAFYVTNIIYQWTFSNRPSMSIRVATSSNTITSTLTKPMTALNIFHQILDY